MIVTVTIRQGPFDGTYEVDSTSDISVALSQGDFITLFYHDFKNAKVGGWVRTASPQKVASMQTTGDRSTWGVHDYRLIARDESSMTIDYIGPVTRGQPLPK